MFSRIKKWHAVLSSALIILLFATVAAGQRPPDQGGGPPPGKGGGGGHVESAGNNLSVPAFLADGTVSLRGVFDAPVFLGNFMPINGVPWYLQQDDLNSWQAQTIIATEPVYITEVDWGDNLESRDWRLGAKVRVETVLYKFVDAGLIGFEMAYLYGEGTSEMWGTNKVQSPTTEATVFSDRARLTIQKLTQPPSDAMLSWDTATHRWIGDVGRLVFSGAVYENDGDGPGGYSAEVNVPGRLIYGYNWDTRKLNDGAGYYRITFSLDPYETTLPNAQFTFDTLIRQSIELQLQEYGILAEAEPSGGGVPVIVPQLNLTYIDIFLTSNSGGGGGGGGGGKGGPPR